MEPKRIRMHLGETRLVSRDYGPQSGAEGYETFGQLDAGELLTGAVTISILPVTIPPLVAASAAVNTAALNINGRQVGIGEAVQFKLSGGLVGTTVLNEEDDEVGTLYEVKITVGSTSNPAQTFVDLIEVELVGAGELT